MEQILNIDLFKNNPQLFFSKLPPKAEKEITDFLQFVIFKYENYTHDNVQKKIENTSIITEILPKTVEEFTPMDRNEIYEK